MRLLASSLTVVLLAFGCKPSMNSDLSLVNGKLDDQGLFPAVVQTAVKIGATQNGFVEAKCTASIISSQVVLTAGHCVTVDDKDPSRAIDGELLANQGRSGAGGFTGAYGLTQEIPASSADVIIEGKRISGGRVVIHPSYTGNSGPDVAVVIFPKDTFKDHKHMAVASGRDNYPQEGLEVMIVGFGKTDQFDERSGGEKRYGKNRLTRVGSTLDFNGQTRTTTADGSNVFNSQGDSGGPMISNQGASKGKIIGVSSTQNQVSQGDTVGEGHYTNLLEESVERFLSQYIGEGKEIDLPNIADRPLSDNSSDDDDLSLGEQGNSFGGDVQPNQFNQQQSQPNILVRPQGNGCTCPPSYAQSYAPGFVPTYHGY